MSTCRYVGAIGGSNTGYENFSVFHHANTLLVNKHSNNTANHLMLQLALRLILHTIAAGIAGIFNQSCCSAVGVKIEPTLHLSGVKLSASVGTTAK